MMRPESVMVSRQALDTIEKTLREAQRARDEAQRELATLRLIVTEKFARDIEVAVKPEDAADVAKWAAHPEAVRTLLSYTPSRVDADDYERCGACENFNGEDQHHPDCRVFLAWAALDDPRAAEAIGAAFDRARPVARTRDARNEPGHCGAEIVLADGRQYTHCTRPRGHAGQHEAYGGAMIYMRMEPANWDLHVVQTTEAPFRLASESEQAARERELAAARELNSELLGRLGAAIHDRDGVRARSVIDETSGPSMARDFEGVRVQLDDERLDPDEYRLNREDNLVRFGARAWLRFHRSVSDARGMEAVEDEARAEHPERSEALFRRGYEAGFRGIGRR